MMGVLDGKRLKQCSSPERVAVKEDGSKPLRDSISPSSMIMALHDVGSVAVEPWVAK